MANTFDAWFTRQFGPEPLPRESLEELENAVADAERALRFRRRLYEEKDLWLRRQDASLRAWSLKDSDKSGA